MHSVRVPNWCLTLTSEKQENGSTWSNSSLATDRILDGLLTKASDSMVLKVDSRQLVLRVLEAAHSANGGLALESRTWKEVAQAAIVILNGYSIGLEEIVDRRMPGHFQIFCKGFMSETIMVKVINRCTELLLRISINNLNVGGVVRGGGRVVIAHGSCCAVIITRDFLISCCK